LTSGIFISKNATFSSINTQNSLKNILEKHRKIQLGKRLMELENHWKITGKWRKLRKKRLKVAQFLPNFSVQLFIKYQNK